MSNLAVNQVAICTRYSEKPGLLESWLQKNDIKVTIMETVKSPWGDNEQKALKMIVDLNGQHWDFFGSHHDAEAWDTRDTSKRAEIDAGKYYSVLASIGAEFLRCIDFSEFCADYGYNEDSPKDFETFQKLQEFNQKLELAGITEKCLEFFPS